MSANNNDQPRDLTPSSEKFFIKYRLKAEKAARGKIEIHKPSYYCSEVKEYLLLTLGGQRQERSPKERDFDLLLADDETGKTYEDVDMVPAGSTVVISRLPKQKEEKRKQWKPVTKKERDELGDHLKKAGVSLPDHCQTQQQGQHQGALHSHHVQRIDQFQSKSNHQQHQVNSPPSTSPQQKADQLVKLPEELQCPICKKLMFDAVLTRCCGESLCEGCFTEALAPNNLCPFCNEPDQSVLKNLFLREHIERFLKDTGYKRRSVEKQEAVQVAESTQRNHNIPRDNDPSRCYIEQDYSQDSSDRREEKQRSRRKRKHEDDSHEQENSSRRKRNRDYSHEKERYHDYTVEKHSRWSDRNRNNNTQQNTNGNSTYRDYTHEKERYHDYAGEKHSRWSNRNRNNTQQNTNGNSRYRDYSHDKERYHDYAAEKHSRWSNRNRNNTQQNTNGNSRYRDYSHEKERYHDYTVEKHSRWSNRNRNNTQQNTNGNSCWN